MPEVKAPDCLDSKFEKGLDKFLRQASPKDLAYLKEWGCHARNFYSFIWSTSQDCVAVLVLGSSDISPKEFLSVREAVAHMVILEVHDS